MLMLLPNFLAGYTVYSKSHSGSPKSALCSHFVCNHLYNQEAHNPPGTTIYQFAHAPLCGDRLQLQPSQQ